MTHYISIDDFKDYHIKTIIASESSVLSKKSKRLYFIANPITKKCSYKVTCKDRLKMDFDENYETEIYPFNQLEDAINKYNSL